MIKNRKKFGTTEEKGHCVSESLHLVHLAKISEMALFPCRRRVVRRRRQGCSQDSAKKIKIKIK